MIAVTEKEKDVIAKNCRNIHFVRTMKKDSKRHHYYVEENPRVMKLINSLRENECKSRR